LKESVDFLSHTHNRLISNNINKSILEAVLSFYKTRFDKYIIAGGTMIVDTMQKMSLERTSEENFPLHLAEWFLHSITLKNIACFTSESNILFHQERERVDAQRAKATHSRTKNEGTLHARANFCAASSTQLWLLF
jgi:hypothetical protein